MFDAAAYRVRCASYDSAGEARHHSAHEIDIKGDGDGDTDSADKTIADAATGISIGTANYSPDADWDRDGTVETSEW